MICISICQHQYRHIKKGWKRKNRFSRLRKDKTSCKNWPCRCTSQVEINPLIFWAVGRFFPPALGSNIPQHRTKISISHRSHIATSADSATTRYFGVAFPLPPVEREERERKRQRERERERETVTQLSVLLLQIHKQVIASQGHIGQREDAVFFSSFSTE